MKESCLISIISPVYNSSKFLNQSIESVLNQSYPNWELILIDDCSTDNSAEIIKEYCNMDSRIILTSLKENSGAGVSRNKGLMKSKGDYVAFLDSDDYWHPEKLQKQIEFAVLNNFDFISSWYYNVDIDDNLLSYFVLPKRIRFSLLKYNNYILTSSILCSASILKGIQFSKMRKRQDWAFFLDILKATNLSYCLPERLVYYRKSKTSLSSNKLSLIKPNYLFFKNYFYNGNGIKAIAHFAIFLPIYFHNKIFNRKKV